MATASELEYRVRETGLRLFDLIEGEEAPSVFRKDYWMGKVLSWSMQDEAFKVQMFRFVDVFPYLTRPDSVARHVKEYFAGADHQLPKALQWGIKFLPPGSLSGKVVARTVGGNIAEMGKHFITGSDPVGALPALGDLRSNGLAFSVDLLGEAVVSEVEAEEYVRRYIELLEILDEAQRGWTTLGGAGGSLDWGAVPKVNVSIKPSAMYSQMSARAFDYSIGMAKERLRPIFQKAIAMGASVVFDMEHYDLKSLTLALYRSLMDEPGLHGYPHTGLAIQAYLRESERDLREMIEWGRRRRQHFSVRLVKGAYWDAETVWAAQRSWPPPVFTHKAETDANFEKMARLILENHEGVYLGCASHNVRSIAYVVETARDLGVPQNRFEYQVLYGMGEPVRNALKRAGLPVRVYAPVGEMIPGMAYLVRRLLENTSNESFLRLRFAGEIERDELLRPPSERLQERAVLGAQQDEAARLNGSGPLRSEPGLDWSIAENRERFKDAMKKVRRSFPLEIPLYIGGKKVTTSSGITSVNPNMPEEIIATVAAAGKAEAQRAIEAAASAFPAWRDTDPARRAQYLFKAADAARKMRFDLAALQVFEVGKTWSDADADVCEAIDYLEYYGREMLRLGAPQRMGHVAGEISQLFYEPRGVAAVIAPWNFPLAISVGMTSAAIVTGNTVVYKPSSQSVVTGAMVYKIFDAARLPAGVLNFLPGPGGEIGDELVTHPQVALIAFTGSKEVGLRIIDLSAKTPPNAQALKAVVAEMGGKNAIIVDSDADMDEAVSYILHSAFGYQGQKCSACSRVIVLEENYDRVVERLKAAAQSIVIGPTEDPRSFMGAVIDESARRKILEYIEIGKQEGSLVVQRSAPEASGFYTPLAIFENIRPEHRLAQEEIFGPVLSIMKARDFDEAIDIANATQYALTGGVLSRSPSNIEKARRRFRVGNLYINRGCTGAIVGRHPFGGFKMSGVGTKAGGPDYLLHFMVPRNVVENTLRRGFAPAEE